MLRDRISRETLETFTSSVSSRWAFLRDHKQQPTKLHNCGKNSPELKESVVNSGRNEISGFKNIIIVHDFFSFAHRLTHTNDGYNTC